MYNPFVAVPFLVWAITQFTKFLVAAARGTIDFRYLYASGGMPSVHSAVVTSLAVTALLQEGPQSPIFGLAVIVAAIVMYDSFGVRRASGEQAAMINRLLDTLEEERVSSRLPEARLREILGHKPLEVSIGALIGLVLGGLFNFDKLGPLITLITTPVPVTKPAMIAWAAASLVLLLASIAARSLYGRRYKKRPAVRSLLQKLLWTGVVFGLVGLVTAFFGYEKVVIATWQIWPALWLTLLALAAVLIYITSAPAIRAEGEAMEERSEKSRWLEGPNKKRRAAKARSRKRA